MQYVDGRVVIQNGLLWLTFLCCPKDLAHFGANRRANIAQQGVEGTAGPFSGFKALHYMMKSAPFRACKIFFDAVNLHPRLSGPAMSNSGPASGMLRGRFNG
jgi:hypothetical protein